MEARVLGPWVTHVALDNVCKAGTQLKNVALRFSYPVAPETELAASMTKLGALAALEALAAHVAAGPGGQVQYDSYAYNPAGFLPATVLFEEPCRLARATLQSAYAFQPTQPFLLKMLSLTRQP